MPHLEHPCASRSCFANLRLLVTVLTLALVVSSGDSTRLNAHDGAHAVLYRINAGGVAAAATPIWSADTAVSPSPYGNTTLAGNATYVPSDRIDITDSSVPAGTPETLFQSERWDPPEGAEMQWSFPVAPGTYEVRLFFAEIYYGAAGSRVFDVAVEGVPVLTSYDIVADVGPYKGVVKSFNVVSDASLDIAFRRVLGNPKVSAIEVLAATSLPGELRVSPPTIDFGSVPVGQNATRIVELTNGGGVGSPSIEISRAVIAGPDAQFDDNFVDGTSIALAPGQSTTIQVSFTPDSVGTKSASLEIAHSGTNSPSVVGLGGAGASAAAGTWEMRAPSGMVRQEVAYTHLAGKFYLAGGSTAHEVYDPATDSWAWLEPLPVYLDHIQAVTLGGRIYYIGGMLDWLVSSSSVYIYDPVSNSFTQGAPMPRPRAAGGVAIYNGKIYYAGGLAEGLAVPWFDMYDPVADTWTSLPDMPMARDHFHAAVVNHKFYVAAGRDTSVDATIASTVAYDFLAGAWEADGLAPIPTPRGGVGAVVIGSEIVVFGGEGGGNTFSAVEAYDTVANTWRALAPMPFPRHGIQAAECNGGIYIAAGGGTQYADNPTATHQVFFAGPVTPCGAASIPPPSTGTVYRVNAGGHASSTSPVWQADTGSTPSSYVNADAAGNATYAASDAIDTTHNSLPPATPAELFQSERWDPADGEEMEWSFPVVPGQYEVRLYFAEIYYGTAGARVFDVAIEGTPVLDDYDIVADVGPFRGVMKSYTVTADDTVNIAFTRVVGNPKVSAIEVVDAVPTHASTVGATPAAVEFGLGLVGQPITRTLQLTNLNEDGGPEIVIDGTALTGAAAEQFADDFDDSTTVTLAPGQSTTIIVTFTPASTDVQAATLQIAHSGGNSPLLISLEGSGSTTTPVGFGKSILEGASGLSSPTSLQFGPDGRLYVGQQDGIIRIFTVARSAPNRYTVSASETIESINAVVNHDDDGTINPNQTTRLITGILVAGTAANPVVYVTHSDPRIGAGDTLTDLDLDTNSSMITRLTWTGSAWQHLDLVRGLPRSEETHAANGMQLDPAKNILYVAVGGNTNKGATSNNFANLAEYALSAAVLSVDLAAIGDTTYDLPTLDDETRPGTADAGDPFGGNDGRNQAILVPGGPVQVYSPGFRNPYDLVLTHSGRLYTIDNGGNAGWGDAPVGEGADGACTNGPNEAGGTSADSLHLITGPGYYGGHPNPTRGNTANTFNPSNPQSPVVAPNPIECEYREAGPDSGALAVFGSSTNGMAEYRTGNFAGAMTGDLLAASWENALFRVELDESGATATSVTRLFSSIGSLPLDVDAPGPESLFPGTIWIADYGTNQIVVFEPNDYEGLGSGCTVSDPDQDADEDGYANEDEIANGTNPCSNGDVPPDFDEDHVSDMNDSDDDNDGVMDAVDPFAVDPLNGTGTHLPVSYSWENDGSNPGGIGNLGFTGLMTNGSSDYRILFDPARITAGGAAGVLTVDQVADGDALGAPNSQEYAFQFGLSANPTSTDVFFVHTRVLGPFNGLAVQDGQSMGLYVGTGDQDNYAKIVVSGSLGGSIHFLREVGASPGAEMVTLVQIPGPSYIDLYLRVDPDQATVQPFYSVTTGAVTGPQLPLGSPQDVPAAWFASDAAGLAVGIISTSRGPAPAFPATWDFIRAYPMSAVSAVR